MDGARPGRGPVDAEDGSFPVWFFEVPDDTVWGATARMLVELLLPGARGRTSGAAEPAVAPRRALGHRDGIVGARSAVSGAGDGDARPRAGGQPVAEIEIGIYKSGRRAYGFDDIAIVPSRRTRDPEDVDISWEIDAFRFDLPAHGGGHGRGGQPGHGHRDRPARRRSACSTSRACGPATRTRAAASRRSRSSTTTRPRPGCSRCTPSPIKPELVTERIREIKAAGVVSCASVTPQRTDRAGPGHPRRRARHARHPGHGRLGRARVQDGRAAQPEAVHPRVRDPGHRRRLRLVPGGACT